LKNVFIQGKSFLDSAKIIYQKFQGIAFALEIQIEGQKIIKLNPGHYILQINREKHVYIYMICEDKYQSEQLTYYNPNNDHIDQNEGEDKKDG
jgi:hypothetical protein